MRKYIRKNYYLRLKEYLQGKINFIQVVVGPRQVGKTTLIKQIYDFWQGPKIYQTADLPGVIDTKWIIENWMKARELAKRQRKRTLLIFDEIQKVYGWSPVIKKLYDDDKYSGANVRVVILGSSSLLMQRGLTESLMGRFEMHKVSQWTYKECKEFFKLNLNEYLYYGGYPAALTLRKNYIRWRDYIRESLIETVISKDVLLMNPVSKPALLRQAFALCLQYPAQIISYQSMLGQLQEAGNASTIAFYLKLLANAFFLIPLEKYSGSKIKQKSSSPKILFLDNSIITANSNIDFKQALKAKIFRGGLFENAIGAKLFWIAQEKGGELFYWRDRDYEIDYILKSGHNLYAIEVKSGYPDKKPAAFNVFSKRYKDVKKIVISLKKEGKIKNNIEDITYIDAESFFMGEEEGIKI